MKSHPNPYFWDNAQTFFICIALTLLVGVILLFIIPELFKLIHRIATHGKVSNSIQGRRKRKGAKPNSN